MADKLNAGPHCTLCADQLVRDRNYIGNSATRVTVGAAQLCPTHDLAGPVTAYSVRVREAFGHG